MPTKKLKQLDEFKIELKKHSGLARQKESLSRFADLLANYQARKSPSEVDEKDSYRLSGLQFKREESKFENESKAAKSNSRRRDSYFMDSTPASGDASPMTKKNRGNSILSLFGQN
jgi:hypothetical protein